MPSSWCRQTAAPPTRRRRPADGPDAYSDGDHAGNLAQAFGLWTLLPFVIGLTVILFALWFALAGRHAKAAGGPLEGRLSVE